MTYDNWTQLDLFENTEDRGSLQEDFLVNLGPLPESEKDIRIQKTVISGQKCLESYQISSQNSSLERMCRDLLTFPWESNVRALTWKRNTKSQHLIFQLVPSRLPTKENESGSLPSENVYPTPTTKGFGHASEGQTLIFRRLVEEGKMTEEEAQQMMNGTTLRPPRMKEWMWPTPTTQDVEHENIVLNEKGRRISKDGKNDHSLNLADKVKFWPTPTTQDNPQVRGKGKTIGTKRGTTLGGAVREAHKEEQLWPTPRTGGGSRPNGKGGKVLEEEVMIAAGLRERGEKLWPTPVSHEARLGYQDRTRGKKGSQESLTTKVINEDGGRQKNPKVQLNPEWVATYLMGYPRHWLSSILELTELEQTYQTEPRN